MKTLTEQQIVEKVKRIIGLRIHLIIFIVALPINWAIWYFTDTTYMWPIWPTLGWSLGIFFHWLVAFHIDKFFPRTKSYEAHLKRLLKAKQERLKNQQV
jgi:energy-coupling factor transporter transmembrane protein EcfT